jgi:hypothetical protein
MMSWIAKLAAKSYAEGKGQITVAFINGAAPPKYEIFTVETANASLTWLKNAIRSRLTQLNDSEAFVASLAVDPQVVFDSSPTPLTQAEIDLAAFKADCIFLRRADKGVRAGVFTGSEQVIVDTKARIRTNMTAHLNDPDYQATLDFLP